MQLHALRPVGAGAGHPADAAEAWRLAPSSAAALKENTIRSTWNFLEISESNPALTHRERSAHLTGGCANR